MSPRNLNPKKNGGINKKVKFSETDICVSPSAMFVPATAITVNPQPPLETPPSKPAVVENKILSYFTKLVNYCLRSAPSTSTDTSQEINPCRENAKDSFQRLNADNRRDRVNKNVMKPMIPRPDKYTSKLYPVLDKRTIITNPKMLCNESNCICSCSRSPKAYDIVWAAIEYGLENGIVLKKGDYFWISKKNLERTRHSKTPDYALSENNSKESIPKIQKRNPRKSRSYKSRSRSRCRDRTRSRSLMTRASTNSVSCSSVNTSRFITPPPLPRRKQRKHKKSRKRNK